MALHYGMASGYTNPISSAGMTPPTMGNANNMGPIRNMGNMNLPLSTSSPIMVTETTPNLDQIQSFPVVSRTGDGIHFHQDPNTGQMYGMTQEFHSRIPQILQSANLMQISNGTYESVDSQFSDLMSYEMKLPNPTKLTTEINYQIDGTNPISSMEVSQNLSSTNMSTRSVTTAGSSQSNTNSFNFTTEYAPIITTQRYSPVTQVYSSPNMLLNGSSMQSVNNFTMIDGGPVQRMSRSAGLITNTNLNNRIGVSGTPMNRAPMRVDYSNVLMNLIENKSRPMNKSPRLNSISFTATSIQIGERKIPMNRARLTSTSFTEVTFLTQENKRPMNRTRNFSSTNSNTILSQIQDRKIPMNRAGRI